MAGFNLGDIIVTIKAKTDDLQRGLGEVQDMAQKTKSFGDKMGNALEGGLNASKKLALGIGVAGAAATAFGVVSVKAFSESEDMIAQTNAVLKSTGGIAGVTAQEVEKLASALEKTTKFSDEEVRSAENLLLTFTSIGKDIFPEATKTVLDMSTALGQDTKSSAIQLGKALQDPIVGVTALRRVGVNFSESQQEVIKNLVETGRKAEAQKLILKELGTEFGGSAEAAGGTFAGALAKLKNQFNNVQEAIGGFIAKAATPFINKLMDWFDSVGGVEGVMTKLGDALKKMQPYIPMIAGAIAGPLVVAMIAWAVSAAPMLLWATAILAVGAALGFLFNLLAQKMGGWGAVLEKVKGGLSAVWRGMQQAFNFLKPSLEALFNTIMTRLWPALKKLFDLLTPALWTALKVIGAIIGGVILVYLWLFINGLNVAISVISWLGSTAVSIFLGIKNAAVDLWHVMVAVWQAIFNVVSTVFSAIWTVISTYWNMIMAVVTFFYNYYKFVFDTLYAIAVYVWQAIYGVAIKPIIDWIVGSIMWLRDVIVGVWQAIWGVAGPIFGAIGSAAVGAWNWIVSVWQGAAGWFRGVFGSIEGIARSVANAIGGWFNGAWESMKGGFKSAVNWIIDTANRLISGYNNTVGKIPGTPHVANIGRFARGTENFAGGGAIVGEEGAELGLFPSGTKIIPHNMTANLVDNLMNVGDMLRSFLSGGMGNFMSPSQLAPQGAGSKQITSSTNIYGDIHIGSQADADYLLKRLDRDFELEGMGVAVL